jgi:hypothetical protein
MQSIDICITCLHSYDKSLAWRTYYQNILYLTCIKPSYTIRVHPQFEAQSRSWRRKCKDLGCPIDYFVKAFWTFTIAKMILPNVKAIVFFNLFGIQVQKHFWCLIHFDIEQEDKHSAEKISTKEFNIYFDNWRSSFFCLL